LAGKTEPPRVIQQTILPESRNVVIASAPLRFGTMLSAEMLNEAAWPTASVPADSFASKQALMAGGQRTVLSAIAKNEPILASKISGPGQRASLSVMIEEGKNAVTIRVDDVLGVAGFVQPDDRVDVLLTRNDHNAGGAPSGSPYTDVLLQNIRVLAIDQLADRHTQAKPVKAVTLEVDMAEAQKLVLAASVGQLSLSLRRAGFMQTTEVRRIGLKDLPTSRAPELPAPPPIEKAPDRGPAVTIIRGTTERKEYDVSGEVKHSGALLPLLARQGLNTAEARTETDADEEAIKQSQPR
jgi:pilus assembly protein CpaB